MRLILLLALWFAPVEAGTHLLMADGEITTPRFAEGDLDGEGRAELVVGGRVGPFRPVTDPLDSRRARIEVHALENGQMRSVAYADEMPIVEDVAIGDVDGDGQMEIVAVGKYRLWTLGLAAGILVVEGVEALAEGRFSRVDAADLDGDGRWEVVVSESLRHADAASLGSEVAATVVSIYRFDGQWQSLARLDLDGHVGDLCLLAGGDEVSLVLEVGGEEVGGLLQRYDFAGFEPVLRHSQQVTKNHVRALNLDARRLAGRSLLAVGDISGRVVLLESRGLQLVELATAQMPGGVVRGMHLTQLFDAGGIQVLGGIGRRGALWLLDGF